VQPQDVAPPHLRSRKCFLAVFAVETNLRRERQLEGIAKAKAAGVYKEPASNAKRVRDLRSQGLEASGIAKALKTGRVSVYRGLDATK
jgi:DNA invertase Pin-like site-specific DNA recombinase